MKRSRAAESVLEHYRQARAPDAAARERMQRGIAQRISSGEASSVLAQEPPRVPPTAAGVAVRPKLFLGLGLGVCALLWAAVWLARTLQTHAPDVQAPRAVALSSAQPGVRAAPAPELAGSAASPASAQSIPSAMPSAPRQPSPRARSRSTAAHAASAGGPRSTPPYGVLAPPPELPAADRPATAKSAAAASASTDDSSRQGDLEEEMRLLRGAYAALRAGRPERALETLAEHATRFPHGALAEARRVARIMALCQAKRVAAARSEAEHFLQQSPNSPYAARVRSLCVDSQP